MNRFKSNQKLLFKAETVFNLRPLEKYEILFSFLDTSPLEILYPSTGRPPIPYEALLKALIYFCTKFFINIFPFSIFNNYVVRDVKDLARIVQEAFYIGKVIPQISTS